MRETIVRILDFNGRVIMEDINIGTYSMIRDIIAWDRNEGAIDELCMLEIQNMGAEIGFNSKMIYCSFNHGGLLKKEERLLDSDNILSQLSIGKLDSGDEKILILDPYSGYLAYTRFFDEEARDWYDYWGYHMINNDFRAFEDIYGYDLDILVYSVGDHDYTSSGSTTQQLLNNFRNQVNLPEYYGANIQIAVCRDEHDDFEVLGRGELPGDQSIIFTDGAKLICHEVEFS
jgi:hypothetical protein